MNVTSVLVVIDSASNIILSKLVQSYLYKQNNHLLEAPSNFPSRRVTPKLCRIQFDSDTILVTSDYLKTTKIANFVYSSARRCYESFFA